MVQPSLARTLPGLPVVGCPPLGKPAWRSVSWHANPVLPCHPATNFSQIHDIQSLLEKASKLHPLLLRVVEHQLTKVTSGETLTKGLHQEWLLLHLENILNSLCNGWHSRWLGSLQTTLSHPCLCPSYALSSLSNPATIIGHIEASLTLSPSSCSSESSMKLLF